MVVKFFCNTNNKKDYYQIKEKINHNRATVMREKVRDLRNDFYAEFVVISHGRFLFLDLKQSGFCQNLTLQSQTQNTEE
ncbi:hypothetical protein EBU91_00480 [bacterium]|jgi:hypothetical protein|nr:hypothetical protein [bacterium]